jgi:predicted transcriptional regulator
LTVITKQDIIDAISDLPDDATVEDAMERLYLLEGVERGIAQADAGKVVTHQEARRRMERWLR